MSLSKVFQTCADMFKLICHKQLNRNLISKTIRMARGVLPYHGSYAVAEDNVGDNVGDIAGMGADLFGSFAESTCAALVIAAAAVQG